MVKQVKISPLFSVSLDSSILHPHFLKILFPRQSHYNLIIISLDRC